MAKPYSFEPRRVGARFTVDKSSYRSNADENELGRAWELTGHREPGQNLHKAGKYMPISTLTRYKSKKKFQVKGAWEFFLTAFI